MSSQSEQKEAFAIRRENIYSLRVYDGYTFARIGRMYGITGTRVRQIVVKVWEEKNSNVNN